ncbi:MAG: PorV/PorQ family protein [candidate division WOR-3 bacterium]
MRKFIVFILIFVLFVNVYGVDKVAQAGYGFLDVNTGARPSALGGAFTVIGKDATALFYNPSCIGELDSRFDLSVGGTKWIADINYAYLAAAYDAGKWGSFGFHLIYPDYGDDFYGTQVIMGEVGFGDTGPLEVSAFCAGLAYAIEFTDKFTTGIQFKYATQHLGENMFEVPGVEPADTDTIVKKNETSTFSADFGLLFYPGFKSFAFGMSVRNFSPRVVYERIGFELPLTFTLGVSMDILDFFGEHPDYSLLVEIDGIHPRDWDEQILLGGEFGYKDMIFLRAGYQFNDYLENGLNLGAGIKAKVRLDYAVSFVRYYDMIHRASAGFSF